MQFFLFKHSTTFFIAHPHRKFLIQQVVVQKFQKKQHPDRQTSWTNLYIKNIPVFSEHFTEDDLLAMFTKFGPVSSLKIINFNDDDVIKDAASSKPRGVVSGASKGFGFVAFGQHEVFELFFCQKGHPLSQFMISSLSFFCFPPACSRRSRSAKRERADRSSRQQPSSGCG